ncbi:hypothetical protein KR009_005436 [Drosophila setifemur]|nr:hypothetical protein KR009_005436 [Drosophila setifemur]
MQNSRVIRRVNAGLRRCLSHHRRLCQDIAELDQLIYHDEFLKDPRRHWLRIQRLEMEDKGLGSVSGSGSEVWSDREKLEGVLASMGHQIRGPKTLNTPSPPPERYANHRFHSGHRSARKPIQRSCRGY